MSRKFFIIPPLKLGKIFKSMFGVWKKVCLPLAGIQLLFSIPLIVFSLSVGVIPMKINLIFIIIGIFLNGLAFVAAYKAIGDVCQGKSISLRSILNFTIKNWIYFFAFGFLISVTIFFGTLLFIIPGIIAVLNAMLTFPILAIEKRKNRESWKRSTELMCGRRLKIFGYSIVLGVFVWAISVFMASMFTVLLPIVGGLGIIILRIIGLSLIFSIWPIFNTLIYFNRAKAAKEKEKEIEKKSKLLEDLQKTIEIN